MEYMSARDAAQKWGITQRRVSILCAENRIDGVDRVGNMWLIPKTAKKPIDGRKSRYEKENSIIAKPFAKWAGGKGQLLSDIRKSYPKELGKRVTKYAEPFVGGGAVLFDIINNYPSVKEIYISDINSELINCYTIIRDYCEPLIDRLAILKDEYMSAQLQKEYYNERRKTFNALKSNGNKEENLEKAALFIFLNKTCFNGLYRVNRKGEFNVPMGAYENPAICDEVNLRNVSQKLQKVTIVCGNYKLSESFIDGKTFVYFDPPYRPLTSTASFTSYAEGGFTDENQAELARYAQELSRKGAKVVVSNSDPKNANENDNFFDELYATFTISRITATRMINSKAAARGKISELLIESY